MNPRKSSFWKQRLATALFASMAACSTPSGTASEVATAPVVGDAIQRLAIPATYLQGTTGFAGFKSEIVRKAAMEYPAIAMAVAEAPLSLTADDGTGLVLESLKAKAVIEGPLAFTELHMRFRNPQQRQLEGRFQITLPEGASVSRLAMRMTDGWREAEVVERMAARRAYEDFLHRKQDPMLLEKEAGNQFRARIFPIDAGGIKEVILSFSHEVDAREGYTLPLRGLPAIDELVVDAMIAEGQGGKARFRNQHMDAAKSVPTKDFHVAMNDGLKALRHGKTIVARLRPELSVAAGRPSGISILFDTSASRAPGFAKQVRRLGAMVRAIAEAQGARLTIHVAAFDQGVTPIYSGAAGDFGDKEMRAILARRPLGASNLSTALSWAGTREGAERVLVIGDAVSTAGDDDVSEQAKAMPQSIERVDVVLVGGIRDREAALRLVQGTRARDGVVLADSLTDADIARRLGDSTTNIKVAVKGASWVWPTVVQGVQPGDEILVYAGFEDRAPSRVQMQVEGAKAVPSMATVAMPGPLLERSAIGARIARLQGSYIEEVARDKKAVLKAKIVDLSTKHRVLSDHTALLVLESESDYARFGIARTALSDILAVGKEGLRLVQRSQLVMVAPDKPSTPKNDRWKDAKKKTKKMEAPGKHGDSFDDNNESASFGSDMDIEKQSMMSTNEAAAPMEQELRPSSATAGRSVASKGRPAPRPERPRRLARPAPRPLAVDEEELVEPLSDVAQVVAAVEKTPTTPALTGKMAAIHSMVASGKTYEGIAEALRWRNEESGNVMALVALGEALEAAGDHKLAARAYGSIIDLFPSRADLRRFAATRLANLEEHGAALSVDSLHRARDQRPDHLIVHRLLAYSLVRTGDHKAAFEAIETGLSRQYPGGRFAGGTRILREDLGIIGAAWKAVDPKAADEISSRLGKLGLVIAAEPSTRFVLNWETDANDVDFHIRDGEGGHAYFSDKSLSSGGELFADVTTGYGPECFAISGKASAFPYNLQIHYYSRGPMGYGMGQVEILQHDGKGGLSFDTRPFVVMTDGAYLDLGDVIKVL
ncbi:MAG: hypothetical protein GY811_04380 [Myxococcales bacterium]|nr:hypothetical protein [Myxococcales bacterium]